MTLIYCFHITNGGHNMPVAFLGPEKITLYELICLYRVLMWVGILARNCWSERFEANDRTRYPV